MPAALAAAATPRRASDPTRDAAFDLVAAVLETRRTLEAALDALPPMEARDKAAAHRLAAAVLRRLGSLDAALEPFLKKEPPGPVRHVLRIGAAGLLLLATPPHAAVTTAVALARTRGLAPFCPLVNAVLRRVAEAGRSALENLDAPRLDTPVWLWASWGSDARAIAEAHQHEAPLDLTLRPGASPPSGGEALPTGSWRYPAGTRVPTLAGFAEGVFWVQDAAAALPAMLLGARPGECVADLCAAPGGKAAQLAAAGAYVTAVERDPARSARLRENLTRLRLGAEIIEADAATWHPPAPFDAVLLDAPCSATGTIRRHPDVARVKRPRDIFSLAARQELLLDAACAMLRPGGRLIYAVCSLQKEEGPERIAAAMARLPLRAEPFAPAELPSLPEALTADGWVRTTPALWRERGGMDGFFIARAART
jgi:16S rRNA (cytosine967-C5)-methyltransferase